MEVKELTILWSIVRSSGCSIYHVFIYAYSTSKVNLIAFICKKYFIEIKTSSWYNGNSGHKMYTTDLTELDARKLF